LPRRAERVPLTRSILPHTNTPWQGALHRTDTIDNSEDTDRSQEKGKLSPVFYPS